MELERMSYPEALEHIAHKAGIELVYEQGAQASRADSEKAELQEFMKRVAGAFHHLLLNSPEAAAAREYLARRALSPDTIERFNLGWSPRDPAWMYAFLTRKGYSPEFLARTGLFSKKKPDLPFFRGRIMFPIQDQRENVVGFGGRVMGQEEPKYLNSAESEHFQKGRLLYGLSLAAKAVKATGSALLCEGYMDVISLHQAGLQEAVAPLGTGFTEQQAVLLRRLAPVVRLCFDSDQAGRQATERAILVCERAGLESLVVTGLEAKDPSEILEKRGSAVLKEMTGKAINAVEYLVQRAAAAGQGGAAGVQGAIRSLFPLIGAMSSEVRRELCLSLMSKTFGVEKGAILRDFEEGVRAQTRPAKLAAPEEDPIRPSGDLALMIAIAVNRGSFERVRTLFDVQDLENPEARKIYIALEESFRNDDDDMERFLARIGDERLSALVMEKIALDEYRINPGKFIEDGVKAVRIRSLERKRDEINRSIMLLPSAGPDQSGLNDLMYEKMYIDAELMKLKE
jgi:DNA primase